MKTGAFIFFLFLFSFAHSATIGYLTWGEDYIQMLNKNDVKGLSRLSLGHYLAITHFYFLKEQLEKRGHTLKVIREEDFQEVDLIIANNYEESLFKHKNKTILLTWEPAYICIIHKCFNYLENFLKVYSWNHFIADKKNFEKLFYAALVKKPIKEKPFNQRSLVTMINNPDGHRRIDIANFYEENFPNTFSLYGQRGWDDLKHKIFKGYCEDKDEILKNHKFLYCFENWYNDYHYISEKILDCFNNLCVPIYSGCTNITDYIPAETFINAADFNYNYTDIHEYISSMDEETYNTYISAIKNFIESDAANNFNGENYSQNLLDSILDCLQEKDISLVDIRKVANMLMFKR